MNTRPIRNLTEWDGPAWRTERRSHLADPNVMPHVFDRQLRFAGSEPSDLRPDRRPQSRPVHLRVDARADDACVAQRSLSQLQVAGRRVDPGGE